MSVNETAVSIFGVIYDTTLIFCMEDERNIYEFTLGAVCSRESSLCNIVKINALNLILI